MTKRKTVKLQKMVMCEMGHRVRKVDGDGLCKRCAAFSRKMRTGK